MRRADRLFRIVQRLRRRGATTARQLAEALEVSERTVYRDVRDLLSSGVPIQGEAGGGYALDRSYELPPLMFNEEEIEALVHPIGLAYWGQTWTLTAWCEMRDGFRNFRLDRIERLDVGDERFESVPGQALADFLALVEAEQRERKSLQVRPGKPR